MRVRFPPIADASGVTRSSSQTSPADEDRTRRNHHRSRVEAVERANELPTEHFKAMQSAPFFASKIEIIAPPVSVSIAGILPQHVEIGFPLDPPVFSANCLR